jgi:hypothetical protein
MGEAELHGIRPRLPLLGELHERLVDARVDTRRALASLAEGIPILKPFRLGTAPPEVASTCEDKPACFRPLVPILGVHYWSEGGSPVTAFFGANGELTSESAREDYALSDRNRADQLTIAIIPPDAEVCACRVRALNRRRGGRLQLWTPEPVRNSAIRVR